MSYVAHTQSSFNKDIGKLDQKTRKKVDKVIEKKLMDDPYRGAGNNGHLKGEFKGLRRIRVGGGNYRIFFSICEECVELEFNLFFECEDCETLPPNAIKLFRVRKRPKAYD